MLYRSVLLVLTALGPIRGGAFAPPIAQLLLQATDWSGAIGLYIMGTAVISFVAVTLAKETRGNNLRVVDDSSAPYAERTAGDAPDPRRRS